MTRRSLVHRILVTLMISLMAAFSACTTETIEVTRIQVLERRVVDRVLVTVEVTRIQRIVETPKPTDDNVVPPAVSTTPETSPDLPSPTATAAPRPTSAVTATPVTSAKREAESLMAALKDMEQTLLSLVQALNSDPIPIDLAVELYNALGNAPTFTIPEDEAMLQSIYLRYREQLDLVSSQGTDLYSHLVQIQSGEATQTEISPIHLSLARDATSAGTSTIQALMRELEAFLASQP